MPMTGTVCDFWLMVLDYTPSCIVMLNDNKDLDKVLLDVIIHCTDTNYKHY